MLFLLRELQLITVLLLISYTSGSTWFISLKLCVGFSIFDSVSFLLTLYFYSTKSMDSLTLKRYNSFQNKNNRKAVLLPDFWFLTCNRKFENSMISTWVGAPKNCLGEEAFKLRKSKLLVRYFFEFIPLIINCSFLFLTYLFL